MKNIYSKLWSTLLLTLILHSNILLAATWSGAGTGAVVKNVSNIDLNAAINWGGADPSGGVNTMTLNTTLSGDNPEIVLTANITMASLLITYGTGTNNNNIIINTNGFTLTVTNNFTITNNNDATGAYQKDILFKISGGGGLIVGGDITFNTAGNTTVGASSDIIFINDAGGIMTCAGAFLNTETGTSTLTQTHIVVANFGTTFTVGNTSTLLSNSNYNTLIYLGNGTTTTFNSTLNVNTVAGTGKVIIAGAAFNTATNVITPAASTGILSCTGALVTVNINGRFSSTFPPAALLLDAPATQTFTNNNTNTVVSGEAIGIPNLVVGNINNPTASISGNGFVLLSGAGQGNITVNGSSQFRVNVYQITGGSAGALTLNSTSALVVSGTNNFPDGFATYALASTSTVDYNGTGVQTVIHTIPYGSLIFRNGGSNLKTITGDLNITGDFSITSLASVDMGAYNVNHIPATGNVFNNSGTLYIGSTGTAYINNFTSRSYGTASTTVFNAAGNQILYANNYGDLVFTGSGTKTFPGGTTAIYGVFTITGSATADATTNAGVVAYNGNVAQAVRAINYHSLYLATSGIKTFDAGTIGIAGIFSIVGATLDATTNINTTEYNGTASQNVLAENYSSLTLTTGGVKTFLTGTISVLRDFTVSGIATLNTTTNAATLSFAGAAASTSTGTYTAYNLNLAKTGTGDLTITSGASNMVTVANGLTFTGSIGPSRIILTTGSNLTIKSDATRTAYIGNQAPAGIGYSITGSTTIERYIDATYTRRWHLLSPPVFTGSSITIYNNWQLSGGSSTTHGTFITNPVVYGPPGSGAPFTTTNDGVNFWDRVSTNLEPGATSSIRAVSASGLLSTIGATNVAFASQPAWFLFVRGARPAGTYNNSLTGSTILRTSSGVNQNSTITKTIGTGSNVVTVNNPFASPVTISGSVIPVNSGANRVFYAWDPGYSGTHGGYKLYSNNVTIATGGAFPATMNELQSSQAIFVPEGGAGGSVSFNEASKTTTVYGNVLRNTGAGISNGITIRLQNLDETATLTERDLTYADFNGGYNNDFIGGEDVVKLANFNENISLKRGGQYVYKEGIQYPTANDSVHIQLWKTAAAPYKLEIEANGLINNMQPVLVDKFLATETPLNANGTSIYNFVSNGEYADLDRFEIVFKAAAALPVTITGIKATKRGGSVNVEWNVLNESGISNYEIEQSKDAVVFSKFAAVAATNNATAHSYNAVHQTPDNGVNYYRIKSTGFNGAVKYTNVVKVIFGKDDNAIVSVYPNPVKGGKVSLSLVNVAADSYNIMVYSNDGKLIASKTLNVPGGNASLNTIINLPHGIAKGNYRLKVKGIATGSSFTQKLIVE